MNKIIFIASFYLLAACACQPSSTDPKEKAMHRYVDRLMRKMTLEEKIGQMTQLVVGFDITGPVLNEGVEEKIKSGAAGSVLGIYTPEATRKLQEMAVNDSRLKIPLLFGYDVIHGHRTIFPINLGLSASWDMTLIEQTAQAAADEAAADGLHWTFSPMVDIARDPRWGRVSEGAGEDPYLGSRIAEAMVRGYEQDDLSRNNTILSCIKHFALYGAAEAGRDYNTVDMSDVRMYNEYLPPYKAGAEAGAASFMTSFNEINGVPATGNRWLLTDLLRKEWEYKGFVVTDYASIPEMVNHGSGNEQEVTAMAINAGVDMDMVSEAISRYGTELVKSGKVAKKTIDMACRRVLEAKYKLGLFEDPFRYCVSEKEKHQRTFTLRYQLLAREAAIKSVVLLKNDNQVLPLNAEAKIAFIGPQAKRAHDLIGSWSAAGLRDEAISLWEAATKRYEKNNYLYALGCNLLEDTGLIDKLNRFGSKIQQSEKTPQALIQEAVAVARKSDIVVAAMGEAFSMSGEAASRSSIELPENQKELLKALKQTGKPIVLVLMNGRPLALSWEDENMDAILETWFAGTAGSQGIADVLFGGANPSGKLTMTYPRNIGQVPIYYNHKNTGRPIREEEKYTSKYLDTPNDPLYPFGYGLSYTSFQYSDLQLSADCLAPGQTLSVSVTLENTGKREGTETIQLYLHDKTASITRPVKELKGFQQARLASGESKTIRFDITEEDLKFYNSDLQWVAEPGEFDLFVGGNSRDLLQASFKYSAK